MARGERIEFDRRIPRQAHRTVLVDQVLVLPGAAIGQRDGQRTVDPQDQGDADAVELQHASAGVPHRRRRRHRVHPSHMGHPAHVEEGAGRQDQANRLEDQREQPTLGALGVLRVSQRAGGGARRRRGVQRRLPGAPLSELRHPQVHTSGHQETRASAGPPQCVGEGVFVGTCRGFESKH